MGSVNVSQQINPPVASNNMQSFSDAKVSDSIEKQHVGPNTANKTDFRSLITNSMDEVKKARKAKENGDFSTGSDAEFLEKLADQTKEKRVPKNELGKDDFLKLFVTQLQNQDPMNPDDGTEMAAKLAQFNGLEQMMNVNKGIEKLLAAQTSQSNFDKVNYIGKEVVIDGGRFQMQNGKPGPAEFSIEGQIAAGIVEVRDGNGLLVSQQDLPAMDKGTHPLTWNGKNADGKQLPDGTYTFSVSARNMDGEPIPVQITSKARITGVDVKDKDGVLFSDFGKITMDQIRSVGRPGFDLSAKGAAAGSTTDDLDRMMAEGKLNLKGGANAQTAANAGATADNATRPVAQGPAVPPPQPAQAPKATQGGNSAPGAQPEGKASQTPVNTAPAERSAATAQSPAKPAGDKGQDKAQDLAAASESAASPKKSVDPKPSPASKMKDTEKNPSNT